MKKIFYYLIAIGTILLERWVFANTSLCPDGKMGICSSPNNSLTGGRSSAWDLTKLLSFIQEMLLKVALPLVIVGAALYIAYELFLAQGNEEKMKQAWKSIAYASVGVISIALGYAIISLAARLSI